MGGERWGSERDDKQQDKRRCQSPDYPVHESTHRRPAIMEDDKRHE
jgi:hypothetical protein